MMFRTS